MKVKRVNSPILKGAALMAAMLGVFTVSEAARADEKVVVECTNGAEHLEITYYGYGIYGYLAQRFAPRHCAPFTDCERQVSYQSRGQVEASIYHVYPYKLNGNFHNEDVTAIKLGGGMYSFVDANKQTGLLFRKEQCEFHIDGLTRAGEEI